MTWIAPHPGAEPPDPPDYDDDLDPWDGCRWLRTTLTPQFYRRVCACGYLLWVARVSP